MNKGSKKKGRPKKPAPREFFIVETEAGWDIKRYYHSFHKSIEEANACMTYLRLKHPHDKFEVIHVREVKKK